MRRDYYRGRMMATVIALIGIMGLGYAFLHADLKINGVSTIPSLSWNVRFKANSVNVTTGSVAVDTTNGEQAARIDDDTNLSYKVRLGLPGDFYEFTVIVENKGSIDAMIDSISSKLGDVEITSGTLPSYLTYTVTYSDGVAISPKQILAKDTEETLKVRLEFKKDIEISELPSQARTLNLNFQINYVQADDTAVARPVPSFDEDTSWDTIIAAVKSGNTSNFTVGSTKTVDMGSLGTHTLRVANNSTPAECSTEGFSQTACGFVLEFADIITTHQMNPYANSGNSNGDGNRGGWEFSEMRAYLNSGKYLEGETGEVDYTTTGIYSSLPENLRNAIIKTKVVSGHGSKDTTNFTTTDKLYLLSTHEVWEDVDTSQYGINDYDTAYNNTRQLDYYKSQNVTTSSYSGAIKQNNVSNSIWWLRSARGSGNFIIVYSTGGWDYNISNGTLGVAPAFRIS